MIFKEPATVQEVFAVGDHTINSKKVDVEQAKAKPDKMFLGGLKPELTDDQNKAQLEQSSHVLNMETPVQVEKEDKEMDIGLCSFLELMMVLIPW